jgi:hypothetical protein
MKNYKVSSEHLTKMFELYEKVFGFESEKSAKIFMELGQINELNDNFADALDYYNNSYSIWEKIIKDDNYDVLFTLSIKLSELYEKAENCQMAYEILKQTETKYSSTLEQDKIKKQINYKKLLIKFASVNQDLESYLDELLGLEVSIDI